MGGFSLWHWLIVLAVILIVFGAGKLPRVMGDLAKGIKNFKSGLKDGEDETAQPPAVVTPAPGPTTVHSTTAANPTVAHAAPPVGAEATPTNKP